MKLFYALIGLFLLVNSCDFERPKGIEISIIGMVELYELGKIKQLYYKKEGYFILGELTEDALRAVEWQAALDNYKKEHNTDDLKDFRVYIKVISKEDFEKILLDKIGEKPEIIVLE